MLRHRAPSAPVMCIRPGVLAERARGFLDGFPGEVAYAVKCNPLPAVLQAFHAAGIRHFDTASLMEIATVAELFDDTVSYFHHPVKTRQSIREAATRYGVRHFVVDHPGELDKVLAETAGSEDLVINVRMATPTASVAIDLSRKFGATPAEAIELLRAVKARGLRPALSFHVGSQCTTPEAFDVALRLAYTVLEQAEVELAFLDVGGGFPTHYPNTVAPEMGAFFETIRAGVAWMFNDRAPPLICEPGRALVADGVSLVVQVQLRKDDMLYINDGIYGTLSDLHFTEGLQPPVRMLRPDGEMAAEMQDFTIYGPTCDSIDVLPLPFSLPVDAREGDWIEVGQIGAYSIALSSNFNGFGLDTFVELDDRGPEG